MRLKVFPATITPDGRKVPLIKGWGEAATTDPEQHRLWQELYRDRLTHWGVPTGTINDILVLDVDVKNDNGFETLKQFPVPETMAQRTMSGGAHYLFKYPTDGKHYGNRVKFLPGLDTRGEGGYIIWYGAPDVPLAEAPAWLTEETAKAPVDHSGQVIRVAPEIAEGIVTSSLEAIREAPEGESNNTLNTEAFRLGQLVASDSITREYAEQVLFQAAKERGKPDYEAKATIKSGLDGGGTKPLVSPFDGAPQPAFHIPPPPTQEQWTPTYFTRDDLLNTSKLRRPQLFQDWSTEDIHITTADGGTGKTTLKLMEAICLALGERFLGFNCLQPGKTLFITGEDTKGKLGAMIGAIARQMGLLENPEKIDTILSSIIVKKDSDFCIISKDRQGFLHPNREGMEKVLEAVYAIRPKMIVFDPISSFWGSEAGVNDMAKAVGKFMGNLVEESHACVEMINHMGKQSSANKDMSQFAGRGGTGLPSNARVSRVIRAINADEFRELTGNDLEESQSAMLVNVNKFTDGSPLSNKPFIVLREGYLFHRILVEAPERREEAKIASDNERVFRFIKEARQSGRYPTKQVAVAHFMNCGDKLSEARVKRAIDMLQFSGFQGEMIRAIENPDAMNRDRAYVVTDMGGKEC